MNGFFRLLAAAVLAALAVPLAAQQEVPMRGNTPVAPQGIKIPPLPDAPVRYETAEGQTIRVSVYARGFQNPWSMAFVSDDTILVAERGGAIKAVRNGVVDPKPVPGAPVAIGAGLSGTDLALHPDFERNRVVYISYTKPLDPPPGAAPPAAPAAGRGGRGARRGRRWPSRGRSGTARGSPTRGTSSSVRAAAAARSCSAATACCTSRTAAAIRRRPRPSAARSCGSRTRARCHRTIRSSAAPTRRPEVFTMGHRTFLRMAKHPLTGAIWQIENGPNGGDEVNILAPGANYGWPLVSLGRTYAGPWQGPFTKEGFRDPIIYWMPAIAVSSITFYTGDRLPKWKGDVFVSGMRYGEIPGTGQLHRILINKNLEELRREPLLVDLRRRIRDVKQGRDGLLYLLTDEADAVMLRIEPAE